MPTSPRQRLPGLVLILALVALGTWGLFQSGILGTGGRSSTPYSDAGTASPQAGEPSVPGKGTGGNRSTNQAGASSLSTLAEHYGLLAAADTAEEASRLLDRLKAWLGSLPSDQAAALIASFIASGRDAALPLSFEIGADGFLQTPPTFRVALLDYLGRIHPGEAHALGKQILSSPTNADEWAISLRNVARFEAGENEGEYLREKTEELIRHPEWQENPSVGYLNAFDVLVHTRATRSTPLLSELIQRKERRDLAHAGFLTLDRLTQREPLTVLETLREDRALHESRPEMVAQQFARADLRQPDQQKLVREWLLDPARTPRELQSFAGSFPNNNLMVSQNLLTRDEPFDGADLRAHDQAVLGIVNQWVADPSFASLQSHLETMQRRLREFTRSPPGGR